MGTFAAHPRSERGRRRIGRSERVRRRILAAGAFEENSAKGVPIELFHAS